MPLPTAGSAAPASGKYGGFGSEDIAKLGYGKEGQFSQPYDPYTKSQAAMSTNTHQLNNTGPTPSKSDAKKEEPKKKKDKKKKKKKDSSSSDSSDSEKSSDESSDEDKKPKEAPKKEKEEEKKATLNIKEAPKASRTIGGVTITGSNVEFTTTAKPKTEPVQTQPQEQPQQTTAQSIMDLLSAPSTTQPPVQTNPIQQNTAFSFM